MEIKRSGRKRLVEQLVIDVEIESIDLGLAHVGDGDARAFLEGHGEKGIEATIGRDSEGCGLKGEIFAEAEAEAENLIGAMEKWKSKSGIPTFPPPAPAAARNGKRTDHV